MISTSKFIISSLLVLKLSICVVLTPILRLFFICSFFIFLEIQKSGYDSCPAIYNIYDAKTLENFIFF